MNAGRLRIRLFISAALLFLVPAACFSVSEGKSSDHVTKAGQGRRALLVGIDGYSPYFLPPPRPSDLRACVADAKAIRETMLLADPARRWSSSDIRLLTDTVATKANIQNALSDLAAASAPGDLVLYYHSGHGGQTEPGVNPKSTYLCAHDTQYKDSDLAEDLALFDSEVKVIVIIDACYSAGMFKNARGAPAWPFAERVMEEYRAVRRSQLGRRGLPVPKNLGENIAFMTASNYDEWSWESPSHGIFTGYLLEGCRRPAVDTNNDREYQFYELHVYAARNAAAATAHTISQQNAQALNKTLLRNTAARALDTVAPPFPGLNNDYNGDGISDLAVYNEETGFWYIRSLREGIILWEHLWGGPGFKPVSGDFNGDGRADLAVYHEETGEWYIKSLTKGLIAYGTLWGGPGLTPVSGDYSGNGVSDLVLYKKSTGYWYASTLDRQEELVGSSLEESGLIAVPGDFNGDGRADFAVYHQSIGYWYVVSLSGTPIIRGEHFGGHGYEPVPGDYDGDGVCDLAVYCEQTGRWHIGSYSKYSLLAWNLEHGGPGYVPVQGDFDGDGEWDLAVYHRDTGRWYIRTLDGTKIEWHLLFGGPGFVPVRSSW